VLLKSLPRVTIHLSQIAFKQYFSQEPELEGHEQSTFITDITDDQIYCGKTQQLISQQTLSKSFYILYTPCSELGVTWSERRLWCPQQQRQANGSSSGRTSGTPSPCCLTGKPGESSATLKCSGSGKHGCTCPRPRCTPHWWQRPGWPDTRCRGP